MRKTPRVLLDVRGRMGEYRLELARHARRVMLSLAQGAGLDGTHEVSILLTDNPTMHRLNRLWRQVDKSTDVLSFPIHRLKAGQMPPPGAIGDIVVSLPYLREAARLEGLDVRAHLAHLLAHGLLHLLGHDHESERDARRMQREERRLLEGA